MILPFSECITWMAILMVDSVAIVTLNVVTIIVFWKSKSLCKRSMYLVINLAVVDMLVGGFSGSMHFIIIGSDTHCNFWKYNLPQFGIWNDIIYGMELTFTLASIANIAAISLERTHATFRPFRHRVIKKLVYMVVIMVIWVTALLLATALMLIRNFKGEGSDYGIAWESFNCICLLVICISYASIAAKFYCGAHPQHHGAAAREKKLTVALLIVTLISLLMWLPHVIFILVRVINDSLYSLSDPEFYRLLYSTVVLYHANSLVNPILYAVRMPEFKRALGLLFRCRMQQRQVVLPLRVNGTRD